MNIRIDGQKIKEFTFPDGQPHINLEDLIGSPQITIRCSLTSSDDLLKLMLVAETLMRSGIRICLEIAYLLGARMDRPIDFYQPFTLEVICKILNTYWFDSIKLFNVHSEVAIRLLRAENILPFDQVLHIRTQHPGIMCIAPDKGASVWIKQMVNDDKVVECRKERDSQTGKLSGFTVLQPRKVAGKECLIIDDICDGGGTFIGITKKLREAGATKVILYVSHGIFSINKTLATAESCKSYALEGIDEIWTTDSYRNDYPIGIKVFPAF
jgi:ribose-phosphate pyrophosphokinase